MKSCVFIGGLMLFALFSSCTETVEGLDGGQLQPTVRGQHHGDLPRKGLPDELSDEVSPGREPRVLFPFLGHQYRQVG